MHCIFEPLGSPGRVLALVAIIALLSGIDSQFIELSYGTHVGRPGDYHLLLFGSLAIVFSAINAILLLSTRNYHSLALGSRRRQFKVAYIGISITQYTLSLVLFLMILEMFIFLGYNKNLSLIILFLSFFSSVSIIGILSLAFLRWFSSVKSPSIIICGVVFLTILFFLLVTLVFLTEQINLQPYTIYPRLYTSVILDVLTSSPNISDMQQLSGYVFPVLVVSSWIITVSLLRTYANRIGKLLFWTVVSIPLGYQVIVFLISDLFIFTDAWFLKIAYSKEVQLLFGINSQISGIVFGISFWTVARKVKRKQMQNYLLITCLGIVSLFCSLPQTLALYAAFPPFGINTFMLLGLSSYLLLIGIVGCAMYVSRDAELRRELHKGVELDSELLRKMGRAEIQREASRKVISIMQKIESRELDKEYYDTEEEKIEDIQMIIDEVIKEVHSTDSGVKPNEKPH